MKEGSWCVSFLSHSTVGKETGVFSQVRLDYDRHSVKIVSAKIQTPIVRYCDDAYNEIIYNSIGNT